MNFIRGAIENMERIAKHGFPKAPSVLPQIHHAFSRLVSDVEAAEDQEELFPFLRECQKRTVSELKRGELNRVLRGAWCDDEFEDLGNAALERALVDRRSSSTRALIDGYLIYFPNERDVIDTLANACRELTQDQDGAWRSRSHRYALFEPAKAIEALGAAMAADERDTFASTCADAGLGASPFATRVGQLAFSEGCLKIAGRREEQAVLSQRNLLDLLGREDQFDDAAAIVRALLEPWINGNPEPAHRQAITAFLLDRVADPRFLSTQRKWRPIRAHIADDVGEDHADAIIGILRRWLTDVAMRTFFRAIAQTTNKQHQWSQRQAFWLAYLDAGVVGDAWPALGPNAQAQIRSVARTEGERLEHGLTVDSPPASSSLIMQIGDLRIAEWSDDGMCRFWSASNDQAPGLYEKYYEKRVLRTTTGRSDFEALRHDSGGNWMKRAAKIIHRRTGVPHPQYGRG